MDAEDLCGVLEQTETELGTAVETLRAIAEQRHYRNQFLPEIFGRKFATLPRKTD